MEKLLDKLAKVIASFDFGAVTNIEQIKSGNINSTYKIEAIKDNESQNYILQRINTNVFKQPKEVMENIKATTTHLTDKYKKLYDDYDRRCLVVIPTKQNKPYFEDDELGFYRCFNFIDNATAYDKVEKPEHFYNAGVAFGEFQRMLADFDASTLYDTIPDFHNTKKRLDRFIEDIDKDVVKRVQSVREEVDFLLERKERAVEIVKLINSGDIPLRVTHNDTKLNNILIDNMTGESLCVIDLDTIMPGSALYDFGDAIRYGANNTYEDDPNYEKVFLNLDLFNVFAKGFVSKTDGFLTDTEIELLPLGVYVITFELAMRFLNDYINGDTYFKVDYPEHNIVRTRNQLTLLKDVESKMDKMNEIIKEIRK